MATKMTDFCLKCGFVSVVGATNAGKSTLVNRLVGVKVSIVTRKIQTTRSNIRGIVVKGNTQIILTDTPGFFEPNRRLDRAMVSAAKSSVKGSDIVLLLVDAKVGVNEEVGLVIDALKGRGHRIWLVLNKIDKVQDKTKLLALSKELHEKIEMDKSFMVSSLRGVGGGRGGGGFDHLENSLIESMPEGEWHYGEDIPSDLPQAQFASEVTREKILETIHQELPFHMMVKTGKWKDKGDIIEIFQVITVKNTRHKGMLLGDQGKRIKLIGSMSRRALEDYFDRKIYLDLRVKTKSSWDDEREYYSHWGLDYNV